MTIEKEISSRLRQWLNGEMSLRQFEDWFVPATWNIHNLGLPQVESMVDEIELNLSEYSDRVITLDELRRELSGLIHHVRIEPLKVDVFEREMKIRDGLGDPK